MPKVIRIRWSQIAMHKEVNGAYMVPGIGEVFLSPRDMDVAQKLGGDPVVELQPSRASASIVPQYVIRHFLP
jgi:hypothetical protein